MRRATLVALVVAVAAIAGQAGVTANPVSTDTDEHVTRPRSASLPHMVFAQPRGGGNDLLLLNISNT